MKSTAAKERRSARRYQVRLWVETDRGFGVTRDFSLAGLYLNSYATIAAGERVRLRVLMFDPREAGLFRLACRGEVLRVENVPGAVGAAISLDPDSLRPLVGPLQT
jgi:hypothetical protein